MKDYFNCISFDEKFVAMSEIVYQCRTCLRIARYSSISTSIPNTTCNCTYPHHVTIMDCIGMRPPIGFRYKDGQSPEELKASMEKQEDNEQREEQS